MSYKITTFSTEIFRPLTTSMFRVKLIGFKTDPVTVQTASFPGLKVQETSLYARGREIKIPVRMDYGPGEWNFVIPDNVLGINGFSLQNTMVQQFNPSGIDGRRYSMYNLFDVEVVPYTDIGIATTKFGSLGSNDADMVAVTAFSAAVPAALLCATLKGCYIKDIDKVKLDASDPTNPWLWSVTVVYNAAVVGVASFDKLIGKVDKVLSKINN